MNPIVQLIAQLRQSSNPEQFILDMMAKNTQNNPMLSNILTLAKNGKYDEIEKIARNVASEKGIDFDKEYTSFKQMFGA